MALFAHFFHKRDVIQLQIVQLCHEPKKSVKSFGKQ